MRALVLCAGYGTRLGALTTSTPKPLLEVGGRPILSHIIANLVRQGIGEVAVNLHFQADQIVDELATRPVPGATVHVVREDVLLGTLGSAKNLESYLAAQGPFLLHYGDVLTDAHFGDLITAHRDKGVPAAIAVHERAGSNSVAVIDGEGMVQRFLERPGIAERQSAGSSWTFSGIAVLSPAILETMPPGPCDLPRDLLPTLASQGLLAAVPLQGYRCAVDSPERLEEARLAAASGAYREPI